MNKIEKTLFSPRCLDDSGSLASPFHLGQTTFNELCSILEVALCPIFEDKKMTEHELALLYRKLCAKEDN